MMQARERTGAVDRGGCLVAKGHAFPFGRWGPSQGWYAGRQSSALTRNGDFRLDERAGFGEDLDCYEQIIPRLCRTLRPAPQAGCFVSRLSASKDSAQITLRHRTFRPAAVAPSSAPFERPPSAGLRGDPWGRWLASLGDCSPAGARCAGIVAGHPG